MEDLLNYSRTLNASDDVIWWIENVADKNIKSGKTNTSAVEHIIDWMVSGSAPTRLKKMSLADATRGAGTWMAANKKKGSGLKDSDGDIEIYMEFDDGSRIVKLLSKKSLQREGNLMSHCLGGYEIRQGFDIFSLRDKSNNPHATFEVAKDQEEFLQIKGKGNGEIHPKYIDRVLSFLKKIGFDLRPSDMRNLGYYHINPTHLEFIKNKIGKNEKLVHLNNEYYVI